MWYYEIAALLTGLLFVGMYLKSQPAQLFSGKLFFALLLQTTASVFVWVIASPLIGEFLFWETLIWAVLLPMQVGLLMIILINGFEMSEMIWPQGLKRRFARLALPDGFGFPRVSIHVPILQGAAGHGDRDPGTGWPPWTTRTVEVLGHRRNNNPHPELWQPVQVHCESFR